MELLKLLAFIFCAGQQITWGFENSLRQIHILYRHGNRAPVFLYKNDPYSKQQEKYWPEGLGQLTKEGKETEYTLGQWLRNRFGNFIGPLFNTNEVHITSTDYDRTLMSAQCVLAAFYYPSENDKFNDNVPWLPTPIHTSPPGSDKLLNIDEACPRIDSAVKAMEKLPAISNYTKSKREFIDQLSRLSGEEMMDYTHVGFLFDTLFIEKSLGLALPSWAEKYYEQMSEIAAFSFSVHAYTLELKKLRAGPLLNDITSHMKEKYRNNDDKKMYMYSAHDTTVAVLLESLGTYNGIPPPYGATVLMELHEVQNEYYVKVFYHNDTSRSEPYSLAIEGCSESCPLKRWTELVQDKIPSNWTAECDIPVVPDLLQEIKILQGILVSVILMCALVGIYIFCKKRTTDSAIEYQPLNA